MSLLLALGRYQHSHRAAFDFGHEIDFDAVAQFPAPVLRPQAPVLVRHFAPMEADSELDLVTLFEKRVTLRIFVS